MDFLSKSQTVYALLEDEKSRQTFLNLLLFNVTFDMNYFKTMPNAKDLYKQSGTKAFPDLEELSARIKKDNEYVIYGAGTCGAIILRFLRENKFPVSCFWDKNTDKQQNGFLGLNVLQPSAAQKNGNAKIIVASQACSAEIREYLFLLGYTEEQIVMLEFEYYDNNSEMQYFDSEIINFSENEVFVDAGACNLETSLNFMKQCHSVKKIYAFEPDTANIEKIEEILNNKSIPNVEFIRAGLWSKSESLRFVSRGPSSTIRPSGTSEINTVALDDVVKENVTFIKMDIEGAELEALKGAEQTIKRYKPKLAISIYHKTEDLVEIPLFIKKLIPEYKLFIRHYTSCSYETVLYAVI